MKIALCMRKSYKNSFVVFCKQKKTNNKSSLLLDLIFV